MPLLPLATAHRGMIKKAMPILHRFIPCLFAMGVLLTLPAHAQSRVYYKFSSGTGFVINGEGHIITNAHVVRECRSISILTPQGEENAALVAIDAEQDLALLKTAYRPRYYAPLRWNIGDLRVGDEVVVMGYPGEAGAYGQALYKKSRIAALRGPTGEDKWIQLSSVVSQGNSGGPVLDGSGNVIAVVTGITTTYRADRSGKPVGKPVGHSDVAITLASLQHFLRDHGIDASEVPSGMLMESDSRLRDMAQHFIVPVRCITDVQHVAP